MAQPRSGDYSTGSVGPPLAGFWPAQVAISADSATTAPSAVTRTGTVALPVSLFTVRRPGVRLNTTGNAPWVFDHDDSLSGGASGPMLRDLARRGYLELGGLEPPTS
jgi:hypothetical protein